MDPDGFNCKQWHEIINKNQQKYSLRSAVKYYAALNKTCGVYKMGLSVEHNHSKIYKWPTACKIERKVLNLNIVNKV